MCMVLVICQHFVQVCVGMCACVNEHTLNACVHATHTHTVYIYECAGMFVYPVCAHNVYTVDVHTQHMKASVN